MKQIQLPQEVAQKIAVDNPHMRFLDRILPLYVYVKTSKEFSKRPVEQYQGWEVEEVRDRYVIHPATFMVDDRGFRIGKQPESTTSFYFGLPAEKHGDIINFNYVKTHSPFSLMLYDVIKMVPRTTHDDYMVDPEQLGIK